MTEPTPLQQQNTTLKARAKAVFLKLGLPLCLALLWYLFSTGASKDPAEGKVTALNVEQATPPETGASSTEAVNAETRLDPVATSTLPPVASTPPSTGLTEAQEDKVDCGLLANDNVASLLAPAKLNDLQRKCPAQPQQTLTPPPELQDHNRRIQDLEALTQQLSQKLVAMEAKVNQCQAAPEAPKPVGAPIVDNAANPPVKAIRRHKKRQRLAARPRAANALRHPVANREPAWQEAEIMPPYEIKAVNRWGDVKRIVISDPTAKRYQQLKVGDSLSNWTIEDADRQGIYLNNGRHRAVMRPYSQDRRYE